MRLAFAKVNYYLREILWSAILVPISLETQEIAETASVRRKACTAITNKFDGKLEGLEKRELLHHQLENLMLNTAEPDAKLIGSAAKNANTQTVIGGGRAANRQRTVRPRAGDPVRLRSTPKGTVF